MASHVDMQESLHIVVSSPIQRILRRDAINRGVIMSSSSLAPSVLASDGPCTRCGRALGI